MHRAHDSHDGVARIHVGGPKLGPDGETLLYKIVCRNKKGITLNLEAPEGMHIFRELAKQSDVILHNFTPGAPIASEMAYEQLSTMNPAIIVAAVSGYGQTGPGEGQSTTIDRTPWATVIRTLGCIPLVASRSI